MTAADFEAAGIADPLTAKAAEQAFHQARAAQLVIQAHPTLRSSGAEIVATITLAIAVNAAAQSGSLVGYGPPAA